MLNPFPSAGERPTSVDELVRAEGYETPFGRYLSAKAEEGFYQSLAGQALALYRTTSIGDDEPSMLEDEWRSSEHFREGLTFDDRMSRPRAAALAEQFDKNEYRRWLIEKRPSGFFSGAAGFAAQLLGTAPSPENFIPIVGPARTAALVARFGRVGGRAAAGAIEGAVGTALVSPALYALQERYGDEMTFADAVIDISMGALVGSAMRGVGGAVDAYRSRRTDARLHDQRTINDAHTTLDHAARTLAEDGRVNLPEQVVEPGIARAEGRAAATQRIEKAIIDQAPAARRPEQHPLRDTRGGPDIFHGTSSPIEGLSDYHYWHSNIYNQGLYTTDAADIAVGYTKKGRGQQPTVYKVTPKRDLNLFDMEQAIPDWLRAKLPDMDTANGTIELAMSENPPNVRRLYDEIRDAATDNGESTDTVHGLFSSIQDELEKRGYDGVAHVGGNLTGRTAHQVRIYFKPASDLDLEPFSVDDFRRSYANPDIPERASDTAASRAAGQGRSARPVSDTARPRSDTGAESRDIPPANRDAAPRDTAGQDGAETSIRDTAGESRDMDAEADDAVIQQMRDAGELTAADEAELRAANDIVEAAEGYARAYEAAAVCLTRTAA